MLVARSNRDVVLSVTRNESARFSDSGYGTLVDKSIDYEVLATCVGMRKDIPGEHFRTLISKASEVVLEKLTVGNPDAAAEVKEVLTDITGQEVSAPKPEPAEAASRASKSPTPRSTSSPPAAISRRPLSRCRRFRARQKSWLKMC